MCLVQFEPHYEAAAIWASVDCLRLPGETGDSILVQGAGCAVVNGLYALDGGFNGQPIYSCKDNGLQVWFNGNWRMGKTNDYYYTSNATEPSSGGWSLSGFHQNPAAVNPPPNVTKA